MPDSENVRAPVVFRSDDEQRPGAMTTIQVTYQDRASG
jgi:hypothetical protein